MHSPIYYPVNSKTNGYVDYSDVEKELNVDDMYIIVKDLQQENAKYKECIKDLQNQSNEDRLLWKKYLGENIQLKQQLKEHFEREEYKI